MTERTDADKPSWLKGVRASPKGIVANEHLHFWDVDVSHDVFYG
jgi:hypothetical protein